MERINDLIRKHFNDLTAGQKAVARLIIEEPAKIALHSAKEIGALTETSETTVIRLCFALGLSGYSMLQDDIRKLLLAPKPLSNPLREFSDSADRLQADERLPAFIMGQDMEYITATLRDMSEDTVFEAVDGIVRAERVVVVGLRTSHGPALWLAHTLNMMLGNTSLYRGGIDDANQLIADMNANWTVIALSFPRYAAETMHFVQAAKSRSARIVAVSDHALSPVGRLADVFLKATTPQPTTLKGMSVIFSLLNVLIAGVMAKDRARVKNRMEQYETASEAFFAFVNDGKENS